MMGTVAGLMIGALVTAVYYLLAPSLGGGDHAIHQLTGASADDAADAVADRNNTNQYVDRTSST